MPTYDYRCKVCGKDDAVIQSISSYSREPIRPTCHGTMERRISVAPAFSGLANALAGDRHYQDLRASDGTPIDSRTKHREYMKKNNLALTGDFKNEWSQAAKEREAIRAGAPDRERKRDVREAVERAIQT